MLKYFFLAFFVFIPLISFSGELNRPYKTNIAAEERAMSSLAADEFTEDCYAGEYTFEQNKCVMIEDDRAGSGHLILKADCMGLNRPLYKFNRFIYVYGASPDSPEPILGTVTFLSDGDQVNQLLWQHDGRQAFFPVRK